MRKERGLTQVDLAVALEEATGRKYDQSMISTVESGKKELRLDGIVAAARELGVSVDYLVGYTESRWPTFIEVAAGPNDQEHHNDVAFVRIHHEPALAGDPGEPFPLPLGTYYPFRRRRLLEEERIDPARASVYAVSGHAMYPILPHGSMVLVDERQAELVSDRIYVFHRQGELRVNRAAQYPRGTWWWQHEYEPMPYKWNRIQGDDVVQGEVRWVGFAILEGKGYGP